MTMFYAASTNGFYDSEINTVIPSDAVQITESYHTELMGAQANGKRIESNAEGYPIAVDPPGPTPQDIAAENKRVASTLLSESDWATKSAIADPEKSNPYLTNQNAFLNYQNQLRAIAINPPVLPVTSWPTKPTAIWSAA